MTETKPAVDATSLKRFFKSEFGIPVRVRSSNGKAGWISVWIQSVPRQKGEPFDAPIRYLHRFSDELGRRCAEIVYPGNGWCWCGNISSVDIAMTRSQWEQLLSQYQEQSDGDQHADGQAEEDRP